MKFEYRYALEVMQISARDLSVLIDCSYPYLTSILNHKMVPGKRLAQDLKEISHGLIDIKPKSNKNKKQEDDQKCA